MGNYVALFLYRFILYPCCGRLTAALRGPNIIKLLCSFCANAGSTGRPTANPRLNTCNAFGIYRVGICADAGADAVRELTRGAADAFALRCAGRGHGHLRVRCAGRGARRMRGYLVAKGLSVGYVDAGVDAVA